jgi:hypothetical protein
MEQCAFTAFLSLMLVVGSWGPQQTTPRASKTPHDESLRVTVYPSTFGHAIDEFAGQRVRIPNARIASVLDPHAFVIESATRYDMGKGFRDRTLVFIDGASLRITEEQLAGSTVVVSGVATTLVGSRLLSTPSWPASLDRERMEHLEVRAVVIATSVQTADGTELTR